MALASTHQSSLSLYTRLRTSSVLYLLQIRNAGLGSLLLCFHDHMPFVVFRRRRRPQTIPDYGLDARAAQRRQPRATATQVPRVSTIGEDSDPLLGAPPSVFATALHFVSQYVDRQACGSLAHDRWPMDNRMRFESQMTELTLARRGFTDYRSPTRYESMHGSPQNFYCTTHVYRAHNNRPCHDLERGMDRMAVDLDTSVDLIQREHRTGRRGYPRACEQINTRSDRE